MSATMSVDGKLYGLEGTISAGPSTRRNNGMVLEAVLRGPRGAYYSLRCFENGSTALYSLGPNITRFDLLARNPDVN